MREASVNFLSKLSMTIIFLSYFVSCSTIDQMIHPDEEPTWPSYEQLLKEGYKGPKARVVVVKFTDSARGKETSQVGDGMAEMLCSALLATNRYIIHSRKPLNDTVKSQDAADSSRMKKQEEIDLFVDGIVKEFEPGDAGAGERTGGTSHVTLMITVTDTRTNKPIDTKRMRGKAADSEVAGKTGVRLPDAFRNFSKTPMEKAIRIAIEESASFIVAKTPRESYRVSPPPPPPKETPKPPPPKVQPEVSPPPQAPIVVPKPILRVAKVVWANVNLREGPGTNYRVIGNAKKGTSLKILEAKGDWLRIRLEDGTEAWVNRLATSEASGSNSSPPPTPPKPTPM
ncbi:MAG: SH3 domain-containing protein [Thermodesulfobacteriota bacterium]